jgi:hypothetical protein
MIIPKPDSICWKIVNIFKILLTNYPKILEHKNEYKYVRNTWSVIEILWNNNKHVNICPCNGMYNKWNNYLTTIKCYAKRMEIRQRSKKN